MRMLSTLKNSIKITACLLTTLALAGAAPATDAPSRRSIAVGDGVEVPVRVYPARGREVLLWLPSEAGAPGAVPGNDPEVQTARMRCGAESRQRGCSSRGGSAADSETRQR